MPGHWTLTTFIYVSARCELSELKRSVLGSYVLSTFKYEWAFPMMNGQVKLLQMKACAYTDLNWVRDYRPYGDWKASHKPVTGYHYRHLSMRVYYLWLGSWRSAAQQREYSAATASYPLVQWGKKWYIQLSTIITRAITSWYYIQQWCHSTVNQILNSQKTLDTSPLQLSFRETLYEDSEENWPCYNGTALYNALCYWLRPC